jgi:hypothetical protein
MNGARKLASELPSAFAGRRAGSAALRAAGPGRVSGPPAAGTLVMVAVPNGGRDGVLAFGAVKRLK